MIGNWSGLALKVADCQAEYLSALHAEREGKPADVDGTCAAYREALERLMDAIRKELNSLPVTPEDKSWDTKPIISGRESNPAVNNI